MEWYGAVTGGDQVRVSDRIPSVDMEGQQVRVDIDSPDTVLTICEDWDIFADDAHRVHEKGETLTTGTCTGERAHACDARTCAGWRPILFGAWAYAYTHVYTHVYIHVHMQVGGRFCSVRGACSWDGLLQHRAGTVVGAAGYTESIRPPQHPSLPLPRLSPTMAPSCLPSTMAPPRPPSMMAPSRLP